MQRSDDVGGLNKFCQCGTTTDKITFLPPTVLAQINLQDSSQSVPRAEARPRGFLGPTMVVHIQATTKDNMQTLNRGASDNRCLQEDYGAHMNSPSFRVRWPAKKGRNTHINIQELETVWGPVRGLKN